MVRGRPVRRPSLASSADPDLAPIGTTRANQPRRSGPPPGRRASFVGDVIWGHAAEIFPAAFSRENRGFVIAGLVRERHFEHDLSPIQSLWPPRSESEFSPSAPSHVTLAPKHAAADHTGRSWPCRPARPRDKPDTVLLSHRHMALWLFFELWFTSPAQELGRHAEQRRPSFSSRAPVLFTDLQTRLEVPDETELPPRSSAASFLSALGHRLTKRTRAAHWCMYMHLQSRR